MLFELCIPQFFALQEIGPDLRQACLEKLLGPGHLVALHLEQAEPLLPQALEPQALGEHGDGLETHHPFSENRPGQGRKLGDGQELGSARIVG